MWQIRGHEVIPVVLARESKRRIIIDPAGIIRIKRPRVIDSGLYRLANSIFYVSKRNKYNPSIILKTCIVLYNLYRFNIRVFFLVQNNLTLNYVGIKDRIQDLKRYVLFN